MVEHHLTNVFGQEYQSGQCRSNATIKSVFQPEFQKSLDTKKVCLRYNFGLEGPMTHSVMVEYGYNPVTRQRLYNDYPKFSKRP